MSLSGLLDLELWKSVAHKKELCGTPKVFSNILNLKLFSGSQKQQHIFIQSLEQKDTLQDSIECPENTI